MKTSIRISVAISAVSLFAALLGSTVSAQRGTTLLICEGYFATVRLALGEQPTSGRDVIVGTAGDDVINGQGGDDIICGGEGNDTLSGGAGKDVIYGNGGNDTLIGGGDFDVLEGGPGNDVLKGGSGSDSLEGGPGKDTLLAGSGTGDVCKGGPGKDTTKKCDKKFHKGCPETPVVPFEMPADAKFVKDKRTGCKVMEAIGQPGTTSVIKFGSDDPAIQVMYNVSTYCGRWTLTVETNPEPLSQGTSCSTAPEFRNGIVQSRNGLRGEVTITVEHLGETAEPFRLYMFWLGQDDGKSAPDMSKGTCKKNPVQLENIPTRSFVTTKKGCPVINSDVPVRLNWDNYKMNLQAGDTVRITGKGTCAGLTAKADGSRDELIGSANLCTNGGRFTAPTTGSYTVEVKSQFGPGPYSIQFFKS